MSCIIEAGPVAPVMNSVSCREIRHADLPAVADLLQVGFPRRGKTYWIEGLRRLAGIAPPEEFPQFGYVLCVAGRIVGVDLLISSHSPSAPGEVRCNGSSWYVEPEFRSYGALLVAKATRKRAASYLIIDPMPATVPVIEALGFRKFSQGVFVGMPLLARRQHTASRPLSSATDWDHSSIPAVDRRLLDDHAAFGCLSVWCETRTGGQPLIFRRRVVKPGIPVAQLVYCRSLPELEEVAWPLGRCLAASGVFLMLVPAQAALRGIPGRLFPGKWAMYHKGVSARRAEDLAYTEVALLGA